MGAEALARGAATVTGIEMSPRACSIIRENWGAIAHGEQQFRLYRGELLTQLKRIRKQTYDRIYFDPPYNSDLYDRTLSYISAQNMLSMDGEVAVEYDPKFWTPQEFGSLVRVNSKLYGSTGIVCYRQAADSP